MKYIAVRKNQNNSIIIDKSFFLHYTDSDLIKYNYAKIEVPDEYFSTITEYDFNYETLQFDRDKYFKRLKSEEDLSQLPELFSELDELTKDMIQAQLGADFGKRVSENGEIIDVLEEKRTRFKEIHNEIRRIQGKEPRVYNTLTNTSENNETT